MVKRKCEEMFITICQSSELHLQIVRFVQETVQNQNTHRHKWQRKAANPQIYVPGTRYCFDICASWTNQIIVATEQGN